MHRTSSSTSPRASVRVWTIAAAATSSVTTKARSTSEAGKRDGVRKVRSRRGASSSESRTSSAATTGAVEPDGGEHVGRHLADRTGIHTREQDARRAAWAVTREWPPGTSAKSATASASNTALMASHRVVHVDGPVVFDRAAANGPPAPARRVRAPRAAGPSPPDRRRREEHAAQLEQRDIGDALRTVPGGGSQQPRQDRGPQYRLLGSQRVGRPHHAVERRAGALQIARARPARG